MMSFSIVGIGAGLASALLFAVVTTGSPLAILLSYVAPLPVLIAALGWRHPAGVVATLAGGVAIALFLKPAAGFAFALGIGLPAWWIAYLALLGRDDGAGRVEWYPLGRLLLWIAFSSALVTLAGAMAIAGDYDAYQTAMRETLTMVLSGGPDARPRPDMQIADVETLARRIAFAVPVLAGASFVPMIVANLWLAAKATQLSGRLPRPWPALAETRAPRMAGALLAVSGGAFLALPGFVGLLGGALFGAISSLFIFTGLAFVHDRSRGKNWRSGALGFLYISLLLLPIAAFVFPALVLLGIVDSFVDLRGQTASFPKTPDNRT